MNNHLDSGLDRETKLAIVRSVDNVMRLWPMFDADAIETFYVIEEWTGISPAKLVQTIKDAAAHADKNDLDQEWCRRTIIDTYIALSN